MRQRAAVAIDAAAAVIQADLATEGHLAERLFRLVAERPIDESRPTERNFGCLQADQTDHHAIVENQRIAIDDLHHPRGRPGDQIIGNRIGPAGNSHQRQYEEQGNAKPTINRAAVLGCGCTGS